MTLLQAGCHEPLKASIHGALGALAAVCLAYNAAAFLVRRDRHLGRNVLFYGVVVAVEIAHVQHHCATAARAQSPSQSLSPSSR